MSAFQQESIHFFGGLSLLQHRSSKKSEDSNKRKKKGFTLRRAKPMPNDFINDRIHFLLLCYPALLFGLIIASLKSLTFGSLRYLLRRSFISTEPPGIKDDWVCSCLADLPPFCIRIALGELTWFYLFEVSALHFISGSCKLFLVSTELLSDTLSLRSLSSTVSSLVHLFYSWADFLLVCMLSVNTNSLSSFDCSTRVFALISGNAMLWSFELNINRGIVHS